jgi:hypothetical protein
LHTYVYKGIEASVFHNLIVEKYLDLMKLKY